MIPDSAYNLICGKGLTLYPDGVGQARVLRSSPRSALGLKLNLYLHLAVSGNGGWVEYPFHGTDLQGTAHHPGGTVAGLPDRFRHITRVRVDVQKQRLL